jgi:predicted RNA-binding protein with PUA-like domain
MALWLFKQEPEEFSYADLVERGTATWDGVTNALALKHLRNTNVGDRVFFYHTGKEKAIVGVMEITVGPRPDPKNEASVVVDVQPVRSLATPVTLAAIKADADFADWELVRMSRLSVMPVPAKLGKKIEAMGKK